MNIPRYSSKALVVHHQAATSGLLAYCLAVLSWSATLLLYIVFSLLGNTIYGEDAAEPLSENTTAGGPPAF